MWSELSAEQNCIRKGSRVVIPSSLRKRLLQEFHADHQGIVRSKVVARTFVWWPGMDKEIEAYIKQHASRAAYQNNPNPVIYECTHGNNLDMHGKDCILTLQVL